MIIRAGSASRSETPDADVPRIGRAVTEHVSDSGQLTQFGVHLQTLDPGATTGERHWHSAEDEFLYVTAGTATVVDDDGAHDLRPGDAAAWRAGIPNAHTVQNRSAAPCTYLIAGSRIARDICTYPDSGRRQVNYDTTWKILASDGTRIKGGDLPTWLLNLRADWTSPPAPDDVFRRIIRKAELGADIGIAQQNARMGPFNRHLYSDAGGLQQFGAFIETLHPGSQSPDNQWHDAADVLLFVLDGAATVIKGQGLLVLQPGDAACWPAGSVSGHQVVNRSTAPCNYLSIGTRLPSIKAD
jgi:uncharacterized cupin superfamily protein